MFSHARLFTVFLKTPKRRFANPILSGNGEKALALSHLEKYGPNGQVWMSALGQKRTSRAA
jgi:hypothetical protein